VALPWKRAHAVVAAAIEIPLAPHSAAAELAGVYVPLNEAHCASSSASMPVGHAAMYASAAAVCGRLVASPVHRPVTLDAAS
jgi:hypothetical protein